MFLQQTVYISYTDYDVLHGNRQQQKAVTFTVGEVYTEG